MIDNNRQESIAFWHIEATDPTTSVNDRLPFTTWLNTTSSEIFVCIDNTVDANIWAGQQGSFIQAYMMKSDFASVASQPVAQVDGANLDGIDGLQLLNVDLTTGVLQITNDVLDISAPAGAWNNLGCYREVGITREAGRVLKFKVQYGTDVLSNRAYFGWGISSALHSIDAGHTFGFNINAGLGLITYKDTTGTLTLTSSLALNTELELAIVLQSSGADYYAKYPGIWDEWTLVDQDTTATDSLMYPTFESYLWTGTLDYVAIPAKLYPSPTPSELEAI